MCAVGDVVIDSQVVFTARVQRRNGRGVVEIVTTSDVRQRVEIENRLSAAEETVRRDLVEDPSVTEACRLVISVAWAILRRVFDKDLIADIILGLREIAVAFGLRRHADSTLPFRHKLLVPFLIPVEEEFVFLLVEAEER